MADTEILQFQLEDGSIAEFEVPKIGQPEPTQAEPQRAPFGTRLSAAMQEEGAKLGGALLGATSAVSPIGDYTLDILAGAIPGVESRQLRDLTQQFRTENPYLSTATDIVGGLAPGSLYQSLAKAPSAISEVAKAALASPKTTNLLESFIQGSARPYAQEGEEDPGLLQRALSGGMQAGLTGGTMGLASGLGWAGKGIGSKVLPSLKQAPTELTPSEQTAVKILGMEDVANLTPEMVRKAMESQGKAAAAGQGGMETLAESLGPTVKGIAGTYAQGPGGREIATQALEGRTSPETLRQQMEMITQPLGKPEPYLRGSQQAGIDVLTEAQARAQQKINQEAEQIYQGAFKEEVPYRVVNEYGQPETPKQFGLPNAYRQQALPPKVEYSPEIVRASEDPMYMSIYNAITPKTLPKGESPLDPRSLEAADKVASELKTYLNNPARYLSGKSDLKLSEKPARSLLKVLDTELKARDVLLPARRKQYGEAKVGITGMEKLEREVYRKTLGGKRPGRELLSEKVDADTFDSIVKSVEQNAGPEGLDKLRRTVGGQLRRSYSQKQGQRLIDVPFEKGDERYRKIASLVGEEKATQMFDKVKRLTDFVKFKQDVLGGSPTQPRQEMARQLSEANKSVIADEIGSFFSMLAGNTSRSSWIIRTAKKAIGTPEQPLSQKEVAKYLFSQGDSATKKLQATSLFLQDLQRTQKGREKFDRLFNSYISRSLQKALAGAGFQQLRED